MSRSKTNFQTRRVLDQLLREDFSSFIQYVFQVVRPGEPYQHNWHIDLLAWHLERCLRGNMRRVIITLPPRHLKSTIVSVAFPAWALGHDAGSRIISATYGADLSATFGRDRRLVMESPGYRRVFPGTRIDPTKNTELELATTRRGGCLSTSVGGTLTGRGGNFIIVDDPQKASDATSKAKREAVIEWFCNTLLSRLDDKARDCIIIVTQRLHQDDLVGHLMAQDPHWVVLNLPAIAVQHECFRCGGRRFTRRRGRALHPARESLETLENIKQSMGSYDFAAQYQQNPMPLEGGIVKWRWFRSYKTMPERQPGDLFVMSLDTASSSSELSSYTACTIWLRRGSDHYLLHVDRERLDYPDIKKRVAELVNRYNPAFVLVEDKGSGTHLIQEIRREGKIHPTAILPQGDKITRMYLQTPKIESGHVFLPESASWLDDFRDEVLRFPRGSYDDQVDSVSQYLAWEGFHATWDAPCVIVPNRFKADWIREFGIDSY